MLDGDNDVLAWFTHGPRIDDPLAVKHQTFECGYHADAVGNIIAASCAEGQDLGKSTYLAFGKSALTATTRNALLKSKIGDVFRFAAREHDRETGLLYMRTRHYDAESGRFITEDPIGFAGGDINLFSYAKNDPILLTDPYGLWFVGGNVNVTAGWWLFGGGVVTLEVGFAIGRGQAGWRAGFYAMRGATAQNTPKDPLVCSYGEGKTSRARALGIFGGTSLGIVLSRADSLADLQGVSEARQVDVAPVVYPGAGVQVGTAGNHGVYSIGGGPGAGLLLSQLPVKTDVIMWSDMYSYFRSLFDDRTK